MNHITTLAVSAGDPDGIGYDLCALLYEKKLNYHIDIYGDEEILLSRAKLLGLKKLHNEKITIYDVKNNKKIVTFGVLGGGCAGFSYKWDYAEEPIDGYSLFPIRDDIKLAVDKTSEMYIMGSTIDYVQELMGSFLKIDNPLTKSSCGCGESFSV